MGEGWSGEWGGRFCEAQNLKGGLPRKFCESTLFGGFESN